MVAPHIIRFWFILEMSTWMRTIPYHLSLRTVSRRLSSRLSRHPVRRSLKGEVGSLKSDGGSCNPCDLSAIARRATAEAIPKRPEGGFIIL